ncbi:xanthine dehydrogenase family protein molybdopterin-binding subunit [Chloroflexota bacterium]
MTDKLSVVGKRLPRVDAMAKVKGEATQIADIQLPGMLHGRYLRSPHAHARIVRIDTREAEALPGVKAILTHENVPKIRSRTQFEHLLDETVHRAGEEVAVVAALTRETAEEALKLIKVEYEILPSVLNAEEAMQPDAPLVHAELGSNIFHGTATRQIPGCDADGWLTLEVGDVEKGFTEADYIIEGTYEAPMQYTCSPMPRGVVCQWTGNKLTCWADTQIPEVVWHDLARCLDMPLSDIRLIVHSIGSYGSKEPEKTSILAALLAKKTGRPVKIQFTREEDFISTHRRLDYKTYEKVGVKKDGVITAAYHRVITNFGADSLAPLMVLISSATRTFTMLYQWQNSKFEGCSVMTNTTHHGAVLGFGDPEANFSVERVMDEAAEKIGMDPVEFKLKNCIRYGSVAYDRGRMVNAKEPVGWGIAGPDLDSLQECIRIVAEKARWREKWQGWTTPVEVNGAKRKGIGMTIGMHHTSYSDFSALVKMNNDGTANVLSGAVDMGQGCATAITQVVAEALGLHYEDVSTVLADTAATPAGRGNTGSSGTSSAVAAAKHAADDAKKKLFDIAAQKLGSKPDDLEARDGKIFIAGDPQKEMSIAEACRIGYQIIGIGINPPAETIKDERTGEVIQPYAVAATIAEVEVDTDTGELTVTDLTTANDCGKAINPTIVENQMTLGLTMGNGWVRSEDYVVDKSTGAVLNPNLLDYKIMTNLDIPPVKNTNLSYVEIPSAWGPYGAKGFSEAAMVGVAPAIANAIYNAIGVRIRGSHLTPDRILEALGKTPGENRRGKNN